MGEKDFQKFLRQAYRTAREKIERGMSEGSSLIEGFLVVLKTPGGTRFSGTSACVIPIPADEMVAAFTHFFTERVKDTERRGRGLPRGMRPEDIYGRLLEEDALLRKDSFVVVVESASAPFPGNRGVIVLDGGHDRALVAAGDLFLPDEEDLRDFARSAERYVSSVAGIGQKLTSLLFRVKDAALLSL